MGLSECHKNRGFFHLGPILVEWLAGWGSSPVGFSDTAVIMGGMGVGTAYCSWGTPSQGISLLPSPPLLLGAQQEGRKTSCGYFPLSLCWNSWKVAHMACLSALFKSCSHLPASLPMDQKIPGYAPAKFPEGWQVSLLQEGPLIFSCWSSWNWLTHSLFNILLLMNDFMSSYIMYFICNYSFIVVIHTELLGRARTEI